MNNPEIKKLRDRIVAAMKFSGEKLLNDKKALGQTIVISENGVIKEIDPRNTK